MHALLLVPPASRLKGSLTDHFREKPELYVGPGGSIHRSHVRPVIGDHERVVDYVLTTVLNRRLSYDEAVLVLKIAGRARNGLVIGSDPFGVISLGVPDNALRRPSATTNFA